MIYFIGIGPGPVDLVTVKGKNVLGEADVIICSMPPVNKNVLVYAKGGCQIVNSFSMTIEQIIIEMVATAQQGKIVAQIVAGNASEFNEKNEQLALLRCYDLEYEVIPGVG